MKITVIGNANQLDELSRKFGTRHSYTLASSGSDLGPADVVFDFSGTTTIGRRRMGTQDPAAVFIDTTLTTLARETAGATSSVPTFGFCGLPSFVDRPVLEFSADKSRTKALEAICKMLGTEFRIVEDRVGMITPRIICMIINEAFFTVQEGTATREDIDLAMKLGTNYPFGPFEWCAKIGPGNVVNLLDAIGKDTEDSRYEVCPLLRKESET